MTPLHSVLAVFVMALWGFNFIAIKIGVTHLPPLFTAGLRFGLVALLLVWFARLPREHAKPILMIAFVMGVVHFSLVFVGMQMVDASTSILAVMSEIPFSYLLAALLLGERMDRRTIVGMVLSLAGIGVMIGEPRVMAGIVGFLMIVGSGVFWGLSNVWAKQLTAVSPVTLIGWTAIFATLPMFALSWIFEDGQIPALVAADWQVYTALAYLVLGTTLVGYSLWYYLLRVYPMYRVVSYMPLMPVFGVAFAVLILGEQLTWLVVAGGILTTAGVAAIVVRRALPGPEPVA
jgi:O-acetylserine/cysteine efflux transporter